MVFSVDLKSRAGVTTKDNISSRPFTVFSDMINMDRTPESQFIPIHDATRVGYSSDDNQWKYDNLQYWFPGYQYSFVAYHPADIEWLSEVKYENNRLNFTYTQPSDYKAASDLLISTHRRNYTGGATQPVNFSFTHILTNVNMQVSYKGFSSGPTYITVDDITFWNIPVESTYSITPAPLTGNSQMTTDWVYDEGSQYGWTVNKRGILKITFPDDDKRTVETNKGAFPMFSTGSDALFLLPNPDDSDCRVDLELNYTTNTGQKEKVRATIPRGWDPGSNLNLSVEIDNGLVQFGVTVDDWKDEGSTTSTIVPRK